MFDTFKSCAVKTFATPESVKICHHRTPFSQPRFYLARHIDTLLSVFFSSITIFRFFYRIFVSEKTIN